MHEATIAMLTDVRHELRAERDGVSRKIKEAQEAVAKYNTILVDLDGMLAILEPAEPPPAPEPPMEASSVDPDVRWF